MTLYEMNEIEDKKDKLKSKLFMKKLEFLFDDENNMLNRCANCSGLFSHSQRDWMVCPKGDVYIDCFGQEQRKHKIDRLWDINKFVEYLRKGRQITWQEIFWKMFARL